MWMGVPRPVVEGYKHNSIAILTPIAIQNRFPSCNRELLFDGGYETSDSLYPGLCLNQKDRGIAQVAIVANWPVEQLQLCRPSVCNVCMHGMKPWGVDSSRFIYSILAWQQGININCEWDRLAIAIARIDSQPPSLRVWRKHLKSCAQLLERAAAKRGTKYSVLSSSGHALVFDSILHSSFFLSLRLRCSLEGAGVWDGSCIETVAMCLHRHSIPHLCDFSNNAPCDRVWRDFFGTKSEAIESCLFSLSTWS